MFHGVVWSIPETWAFFSSEMLKWLFCETNFLKVLHYFTFVCNDGTLNLCLQVLALPASATTVRPTKTSQKLNIYRLDFQIEFFGRYKSNNVFRFSFYYFGAIIHSLSFLDAVVRCGWFHLGRWKFQMLPIYWRRKRSPYCSDIPALKLDRYFTGIAAETTAAISPVKSR